MPVRARASRPTLGDSLPNERRAEFFGRRDGGAEVGRGGLVGVRPAVLEASPGETRPTLGETARTLIS